MLMKIISAKSRSIILIFIIGGLTSCGVETMDTNSAKSGENVYPLVPATVSDRENDTIITFDPKTYKESVTVIKYTNGQADTIQVD